MVPSSSIQFPFQMSLVSHQTKGNMTRDNGMDQFRVMVSCFYREFDGIDHKTDCVQRIISDIGLASSRLGTENCTTRLLPAIPFGIQYNGWNESRQGVSYTEH